jgi:hypothetical protein
VPVVEGHGEAGSVRILLQRVWEFLEGEYVGVLQPVRQPRGRLVQEEGPKKANCLALKALRDGPGPPDPPLVLILIDADEDCPVELGPRLLALAKEAAGGTDVSCVVVKVEYETWFAASAESLASFLELPPGFAASESPESSRHGRAWVEQRFQGGKYSETRDQPAITAAMDLGLCRGRSPSFDKLCRELEKRLIRSPGGSEPEGVRYSGPVPVRGAATCGRAAVSEAGRVRRGRGALRCVAASGWLGLFQE